MGFETPWVHPHRFKSGFCRFFFFAQNMAQPFFAAKADSSAIVDSGRLPDSSIQTLFPEENFEISNILIEISKLPQTEIEAILSIVLDQTFHITQLLCPSDSTKPFRLRNILSHSSLCKSSKHFKKKCAIFQYYTLFFLVRTKKTVHVTFHLFVISANTVGWREKMKSAHQSTI